MKSLLCLVCARASFSCALFAFIVAAATAAADPPLVLNPGDSGPLPGTTAAEDPRLIGTILVDDIEHFQILGAGGVLLYEADFQTRVVRSDDTGTLLFYFRILNPVGGLNGIVEHVFLYHMGCAHTEVFYRPDGLGSFNYERGRRTPDVGDVLVYETIGGGLSSSDETFFHGVFTEATQFDTHGLVRIELTTGEAFHLDFPRPLGAIADLVNFDIPFGFHVSGGISELETDDGNEMEIDSQFGFSATEPNIMQLVVRAETALADPRCIRGTINARLNNSGGVGRLALFNFNTNQFDTLLTMPIGLTDEYLTHRVIFSTDYITANGTINLSFRSTVIATFAASGFRAFVDLTQVDVR